VQRAESRENLLGSTVLLHLSEVGTGVVGRDQQ
jgi:hypothetical protein